MNFPDVIQLNNGLLLLGKTPHKLNEVLTSSLKISEISFENFRSNMISRRNYCNERGLSYQHFIFPEKTSYYPSYYPYGNFTSIADLCSEYFTDDVVAIQDRLPKEDLNVFLKTDTHLSFEGEMLTSIEILKCFFDIKEKEVIETFQTFRIGPEEVLCDLGKKLTPPIKEMRYSKKTPFLVRYDNRTGVNDGLFIICMNKQMLEKNRSKRLLIFGDSFMEMNLQFLSYFYSDILYCRTRFFHREIIEQFCPDHVITENAERYLVSIKSDAEAPRFNCIFPMRGVQVSQKELSYKALNAQLNFGRKPYEDFIHEFKVKYTN